MGSECIKVPSELEQDLRQCRISFLRLIRCKPIGKEGVHKQREVPDFGKAKSAEKRPRAKRECNNKEWCQTW